MHRVLRPTERVVAADTPSYHGLWAPGTAAVLTTATGLLLDNGVGILAIILAGGPIYKLVIVALQARRSMLLVTNERVLFVTRAFGDKTRSIPLEHVAAVRTSRTLVGRLAGVWALRITTSAQRPNDERDDEETGIVAYGLRDALHLREAILPHTRTTTPRSVTA